jgi:folylpolyglutamate synthase/dihydrofolate synthase
MSIQLGLERIDKLLAVLGNPQNDFETVHVAGTNGKGSTSTFITSALVENGIHTGSFNSPHLLIERDAIRINRNIVRADIFEMIKGTVYRANETIGATSFEVITAIAFCCFSKLSVKLAVIEVGLGGTQDATNIIPPPLIAVLTNIGFDHTEYLGNSILEIAQHKAGIMKRGSKGVVIGYQDYKECTELFEKIANNLRLVCMFAEPAKKHGHGCILNYDNKTLKVKSMLAGEFQLSNISAASLTIELLGKNGYKINPELVVNGLEKAFIAGRLQTIRSAYGELLIDAAHNEAGIKRLKEHIEPLNKKIFFICAFSGNRDSRRLLDLILKDTDLVAPVIFRKPEGMPWTKCQCPNEILSQVKNGIDVGGSLENALAKGKHYADHQIVVFGSLYLIAELFHLLQISDY